MRLKISFLLIVLLMLSITGYAQDVELGHTGIPAEAVEEFAFLVGDWQITSTRNLSALNEEPEWEEMTAVSSISPHLDGNAFIEYVVGVKAGELWEMTVFRGAKDRVTPWDMIMVESNSNRIHTLSGRFDDDNVFSTLWRGERAWWHLTIENITDDSFDWVVRQTLNRNQEGEIVWTMHYERIDTATAAALAEELRTEYTMSPPPDGLLDFSFWIGEWDVLSKARGDDYDPYAGYDTLTWVNGGHAMEEHWVALWDEGDSVLNPFEAISLTIFNTDSQSFNNVWWSTNSAGAQAFNGGTCQGEGADKRCRLAGQFYNITDESIDWRIGAGDTPSWAMEFSRAE